MSVGLWILLILLLLLIGLLLLPVGVDAEYNPEGFFLRVKAGPVRLTILPKKPKKPDNPEIPESPGSPARGKSLSRSTGTRRAART